MYDKYTDEAIAHRLRMIAVSVRAFNPAERAAILTEAAKRVVRTDSDELQKFKERVRDRMIREADRRNWCSEFDSIINEFGMRGRFGNYVVKYRFKEYRRGYTPDWEWHESHSPVIARDGTHARELVSNSVRRTVGHEFEILSVEEKP